MKSIDEYKKEILLKIMSGEELDYDYMWSLPQDDSLRTFMCELGPMLAYEYARFVDKSPNEETRKAACGDPRWAYMYAHEVDKCPHEETRKAACGDLWYAYTYAWLVDKYPHEETKEVCYRDPEYKQLYIKELGE